MLGEVAQQPIVFPEPDYSNTTTSEEDASMEGYNNGNENQFQGLGSMG